MIALLDGTIHKVADVLLREASADSSVYYFLELFFIKNHYILHTCKYKICQAIGEKEIPELSLSQFGGEISKSLLLYRFH